MPRVQRSIIQIKNPDGSWTDTSLNSVEAVDTNNEGLIYRAIVTLVDVDPIPPRPWEACQLMIRDANRNRVIHFGGTTDAYGKTIEPEILVALAQYITDAVNFYHTEMS